MHDLPIVTGDDGSLFKRMTLVEGPSGSGKTHQLRTLVDGGMKVLAASTERKMSTVKDLIRDKRLSVWPINDYRFPTTLQEKQQILADGKENVIALFDYLRGGEHEFDAVYFDSFMRYAWKQFQHLAGSVKGSNGKLDKRAAYGVFGTKMKTLLDLVASLCDSTTSKRPVHFIGTWGVERGQDYLGRSQIVPIVDGQMVGPQIDYHFDDVLMLRMEEDPTTKKKTYTMHTAGESSFAAKVSKPPSVYVPEIIEDPSLFKLIQVLEGEDSYDKG